MSASVFNDAGKLLLVQRTDDSTWCLPCGRTEVCESPQQSLKREVAEETGLEVAVKELIRLWYRMPGEFDLPHTTYHLQFHCVVTGGSLRESFETTNVGFYDIDTVTDWHLDHRIEAEASVAFWLSLSEQSAHQRIACNPLEATLGTP